MNWSEAYIFNNVFLTFKQYVSIKKQKEKSEKKVASNKREKM